MAPQVISVLIGCVGLIVGALPTYVLMRRMKEAELEKLHAETDKIRAEAEKIRAEFRKVESLHLGRLRLLFAAANPVDLERLRLDAEIRGIAQGFRESKNKHLLELDQLWSVRWTDLRTHLLRDTPDILHFSGIAEEAGLVFEDDAGCSDVIAIEQIEALFSLFADRVRLIVLNTNGSDKLGDRLAKTIECVIGVDGPVADYNAAKFSAAFYEAIADGKSIKKSFDFAVANVGTSPGSGHYKLFGERRASEIHLIPNTEHTLC